MDYYAARSFEIVVASIEPKREGCVELGLDFQNNITATERDSPDCHNLPQPSIAA